MTPEQAVDAPRELTDEDLATARKLIGVELRRTMYGQWNYVATADAIRHFCDGIADENPLHRDPVHAAASVHGKIVASHMFLITVDRGIAAPGLPGVQYIHGSSEYSFRRRVIVDEPLSATVKLADAKWFEAKGTRVIDQISEVTYFNPQTDEVVATHRHHTLRMPRRARTGGLQYAAREPYHYSPEQIEQIWEGITAEEIRGSTPRLWSEVQEGDVLASIVKPPLSIIDILQWYAGSGCLYRAHEMAWKHFRAHPGDAHPDPRTGVPSHAARGHLDGAMAGQIGMPGVYDVGNQRISWLAQLIEYWMGDAGALLEFEVQLRRPNIVGDASWCRAKVARKVPGDRPTVELELWIENQRGEINTKGRAVVALPAK